MEGACGVAESTGKVPDPTGCPTLPPVTFEYQEATLANGNAKKSPVVGDPAVGNDGLQFVMSTAVVDFNYDGRPDIVQAWPQNYTDGATNTQFGICRAEGSSKFYVAADSSNGWGASLLCAPGSGFFGDPDVLRSAGEQIAYVNRGGVAGGALTLQHNCLDAGDGSPNTLTGFVIERSNGSSHGSLAALFNQYSAEAIGPWGSASVLWSVAGYRGFGIEPTSATAPDANRFCANINNGAKSWPTLRWRLYDNSPTNWVQAPADDQNAEYRQILDVDGDGYDDLISESTSGTQATSPSGRFKNASIRPTMKLAKSEVKIGEVGPILRAFVKNHDGYDPVTFTPSNWAFSTYADINGDGIQDLITSDPQVDGGIPQVRPGNSLGQFGCDRGIDVACVVPADGTWVGRAYRLASADASKPWPLHGFTPYGNGAVDTHFFHDVTGDGLADIIAYQPSDGVAPGTIKLWINIEGTAFRCANSTDCVVGHVTETDQPFRVFPAYRVVFADFDADGTDDFVLLGKTGVWHFSFLTVAPVPLDGVPGTRSPVPGLLTRIRNGVGAETEVVYETIQELELKAANSDPSAFDAPWLSHSPAVLPVVTRIWTRDSRVVAGASPVEPFQLNRPVEYQYRDPAYDPWEKSFKGWGRVRSIGSDGMVTQNWYWFSPCARGGIVDIDCSSGSDEYSDKALEGALVRVDTFAFPGRAPLQWLSTVTTAYAPVAPESSPYFIEAVGGDRAVLFTPPVATDTYLYDTGTAVSSVGSITHPTSLQAVPRQGGIEVRLRTSVAEYSLEGTLAKEESYGHVGLGSGEPIDPAVSTRLLPESRCEADWLCLVREEKVFALQTDAPELLVRHALYGYNTVGDLTNTSAELLYPQFHPAGVARVTGIGGPTPPNASSAPGIRSLRLIGVDSYGNIKKVEGQSGTSRPCTTISYDTRFNQFPRTTTVYAGDDCSGTSEATSFTFDRGLGMLSAQLSANNTLTTMTYDQFGRLFEVYAPAPDAGSFATELAVRITTHSQSPVSWREIRRRVDVDAYVTSLELSNGLGEPALAFDQADQSVDGAPWIARDWFERTRQGVPLATYRPWFYSGDAYAVANSAPGLSVPGSRVVNISDRFGRTLQVADGARTIASYGYLPLKQTIQNATQLNPSSRFAGLSSSMTMDGFGRTTNTTTPAADGSDQTNTHVIYSATGEPIQIERKGMNDPSAYVRTMEWDSFARLVHNREPNTGGDTAGWEYEYDDEGRLVGTSDARGCGENIFYDARGRMVAEDYSPCLANQPSYSAPDLTTGDGTEAFYTYDQYESDQVSATETFDDSSQFAVGHLVSVRDRGAHTRLSYDARGRVRRTGRQMAIPSADKNQMLANRYTSRWFTREGDFDLGNRPTKITNVDSFDGGVGKAYSAFDYSLRGVLKGLSSKWGTLVSGMKFTATGNLSQATYGDLASTRHVLSYDAYDRLSNAHLFRPSSPSLWTTSPPPSGYTLPAASDGATELDLANLTYGRDDDGATTSIHDNSGSTWPTGASPVSRDMSYDAAHRLQSVSYAYTANGSYRPPFLAEIKAGDNKPIPTAFADARVRSQSFAHDAQGNVRSSDDDKHLRFDRSLGAAYVGTGSDGVLRGPNQFLDAEGIHAAYDVAGNLTELTVERTDCTVEEPQCSMRFVYDWDEVGHMLRARRYDYSAGPVPAFDGAATPTWELGYAYSEDIRVRVSASSEGAEPTHTLEIFDTHRVENTVFDVDAGYHPENTYDESVFLAGGLARAFDDRDAPLPRAAGSVHVFINVGDALGSSAFVLDKATGELVEKTTYQPYGAVESDLRPNRWRSPREALKFTGKEEDVQVGVSYFGARYYNSHIARWMSPDPLAIHGLSGDPNPYAYVGGTVFDATDPFGLAEAPDGEVTVRGNKNPQLRDIINDHAEAMSLLAGLGNEIWGSTGVGNLVSAFAALGNKKSRATQSTTARGVVAGTVNAIPGMNGSYSVPSLILDRFPMAQENSSGYVLGGGAVQVAALLAPAAIGGGLGAGRVRAPGPAAAEVAGAGRGGGIRAVIERQTEESLAGNEFFLHGTTAEVAENFELEAGRRLHTTTSPAVARLFGERTVAKAGGGEVGGVAVVLPRTAVNQLRSLGQLTVRPISDMPQHLEWIFGPGAHETIIRQGTIVILPPGAL